MGEVYQARDTRLNRDVALKTIPESFATVPDRLGRFKREAQVLAALNHPNIGSIFGFEESNGVHALVLELVEGPTLADRIAPGALALEDVLPIARQIADALDAAHAQGIVHRDLKPANIKVRPDGTVKVLDFGLAKALADDPEVGAPASAAMTSPALTHLGTLLGTAAYMSPEQARARTVDKRSDIWAFGAVLYEMLTGARAFGGDDISETLASVLKGEPDWNALPADTPAAVRRVLRRCLEKDPKRRAHDIADVRLDLDEQAPMISDVPSGARPRRVTLERAAWTLLTVSLAGALAYRGLGTSHAPPVVRFQIDPPAGGSFGGSSGVGRLDATSGAAVSPDGTQLAFVATEPPERTQLWVRRIDSFTSRPLPGTDNALQPFWSPDGRWIGFFADNKLKRIDTLDGSVLTIADTVGIPRGGTWGSRDVIVFSAGTPPRMARVLSRGGEITTLETAGGWPSFLPDGRQFLYTGLRTDPDGTHVMLGSIEPATSPRALIASDGNGIYAPPGLVLFTRGGRLLQQRFDANRLEMAGEPTTVVEQVFNPGSARADFSASANGVLAYRSGSNRSSQFAWFDRAGTLLGTIGPPGNYRTPDLSPDGQRLVYGDTNQRDLWIFDLPRQTSSRFTSGPGTETAPVWFPDGSKIVYRNDSGGLFEKDVTGTGSERRLLTQFVNGPCQVSADGKWILYFAVTPGGNQDVYAIPTSGEPTPQILVQTAFPDVEPQFSPDVRWLAYASNENGRNEIYVQAFPSTGRRWQVSSNGGRQPLWRADGKELFFVSDDRKFYAVSVSANDSVFEFGVPQLLFDMRANVFNTRNSYVPSRDGKRFLVNMLLDADNTPISIVQNWHASAQ